MSSCVLFIQGGGTLAPFMVIRCAVTGGVRNTTGRQFELTRKYYREAELDAGQLDLLIR